MISAGKVADIIKRFETTRNMELGQLMEDARVLSCQMYYYAETMGSLGQSYRRAHVDRKTFFSKAVSEKITSGDSAVKAKETVGGSDAYKAMYQKEYDL